MCAASTSAVIAATAVFEFLDSTHREIQQQLRQLHQLVDAIENGGLNQATREKARRGLTYFNGEGRQHHLGEGNLFFPWPRWCCGPSLLK